MTQPAKVLIGLPCYDGWIRAEQARFFQEARGARIEPAISMPTDVARNWLVSLAQRGGFDVLFMLDADAAPSPQTYWEFVLRCQQEQCVVAAPYTMHGGGVVPLGCAELRDVQRTEKIVGTHCIAYSVPIFSKIIPPYFEYRYDTDHGSLLCTEDAVCHQKLLAAGVPVYVDGRQWAGHVKSQELGRPRIVRLG
jgi:hypothetical protein